MAGNMFEELKNRKARVASLLAKAHDLGWLPDDRYKHMAEKLETSTLTIGVIGQMKAGKSTFLNAFVFRDEVLPAATTPMTAALSTITYGETKRIRAEFYTQDEWAEQVALSRQDEAGFAADPVHLSKIKAAKELVATARSGLGGQLESLLGQTKEDKFGNLREYVGAKGRYVGITKSVTVFYPADYLKGVEIVDTPGFNDPVVSREERTKEFLKRADVVILMLYAGEPFSAEDRAILFTHVGQCGIGKVLIAINKYDIPYLGPQLPDGSFDASKSEGEDTIRNYVKEQIARACREEDDDSLRQILADVEPIPLSAEMALLSMLPMAEVGASRQNAWERYCVGFGISSQPEMLQWSRFGNLEQAVRDRVLKEKGEILFAKPLNAIKAIGRDRMANLEREIGLAENDCKNLSMTDDQLLRKLKDVQKAQRKINKFIGYLDGDLNEVFEDAINDGNNRMQDAVNQACDEMGRIVDDANRLIGMDKMWRELKRKVDALVWNLKTMAVAIETAVKRAVKSKFTDFCQEAEECFTDNVKDYDMASDMKHFRVKFEESDEAGSVAESEEGKSWIGLIRAVLFGNLLLIDGVFERITGFEKQRAYDEIEKIKNGYHPEEHLRKISLGKNRIIEDIQACFKGELLDKIEKQVLSALNEKEGRENKLAEVQKRLEKLKADKKALSEQDEEIQAFL